MQQGLKKGMEKGKQEQSVQIARNLKSDGIPNEIIAKNTGLSIEEVEML